MESIIEPFILNLLYDIEDLGVDVTDYKVYFENYSKKAMPTLREVLGYFATYNNLKNKYSNYVELNNTFKNIDKLIKSETDLSFIDKEKLIEDLEKVKSDDLFPTLECLPFINFIYRIICEYMKLEILHNSEYTVYQYVLNNFHDYWYINAILENEIEELLSSINFVPGAKELQMSLNENLKDGNYLNIDILKSLIRCNYPEDSLIIASIQYKRIYANFESIFHMMYVEPINYNKLKRELDYNVQVCLKFIKEKGFLFSLEESEKIDSLNEMMENTQKAFNSRMPTKKRRMVL